MIKRKKMELKKATRINIMGKIKAKARRRGKLKTLFPLTLK